MEKANMNDFKFHWLHPDVESRATGTHGDGLYALREIKAGECVLIFGGYILTVEQEAQLAGKLSDNGVQIAKNLVICSTRPEEWGGENFLNHSCEPNAGFKGQIAVVAMRDIESGEQITIDYAMVLYHSPDGPAYRLDCLCGAPTCRGVVTDDDWRIAALQAKYRGWFQPFLQEEIDRSGPHCHGIAPGAVPPAPTSHREATTCYPPPQTYPAVSIEIKPSIILPGEIGVFATRRFAKDSIIVPAAHFADARLLEWAVFKTLDAVTKRKLMGYCPGTPEGLLAPADLNYISVAWQMNHSCQPNVGFNATDDFVAMRAIKRGEELCWDYAFAESNPKFRMKCRCGAVDCRGVVTGKDWRHLMSEPAKRGYFSSDLRRLVQDLVSGEGEANRRPASADFSETELFHDPPPPRNPARTGP